MVGPTHLQSSELVPQTPAPTNFPPKVWKYLISPWLPCLMRSPTILDEQVVYFHGPAERTAHKFDRLLSANHRCVLWPVDQLVSSIFVALNLWAFWSKFPCIFQPMRAQDWLTPDQSQASELLCSQPTESRQMNRRELLNQPMRVQMVGPPCTVIISLSE